MKTSVLIIAHNEEKYIYKCIQSVLNQTKKADEIVLVVHNSSDETLEIAKQFPITVIPFSGPEGSIYARIKGLENISNDIILCTDGDTVVAPNWIELMTEILNDQNVFVGSWVRFKGNLYNTLNNFWNKYACVRNNKPERWIWGASFGFFDKDKNFIKGVLEKTQSLSKEIGLSRNPDDYFLAIFMRSRGKIAVTNKTWVTPYAKENSLFSSIKRHRENIRNGNKIEKYFKSRK